MRPKIEFTPKEMQEMKHCFFNKTNRQTWEQFHISSATLNRIKREQGWVKKRNRIVEEKIVIPEYKPKPQKRLKTWPKGFNAILGYAY